MNLEQIRDKMLEGWFDSEQEDIVFDAVMTVVTAMAQTKKYDYNMYAQCGDVEIKISKDGIEIGLHEGDELRSLMTLERGE